jgi:hypothetical protein
VIEDLYQTCAGNFRKAYDIDRDIILVFYIKFVRDLLYLHQHKSKGGVQHTDGRAARSDGYLSEKIKMELFLK